MAAKKSTIANRLDEIARLRARLLIIGREVDEAERAPLPRAETETRIDEVVERVAGSLNRHQIGTLLISPPRPGAIDFATTIGEHLAGDPNLHQGAVPAGALLAAVAPDLLREWLLSAAAAAAEDHPPPLTADERRQRLELLAAERADLERDEAAACWTIEDSGQPAPWRGDENPEIVLGLEG